MRKKYIWLALLLASILVLGLSCGQMPVPAFSASTTAAEPGDEISFTDESTGDPTSWSWDFGDGGTSTEQNPSYTYDTAGVYDVKLVVTNEKGTDSLTREAYITIEEGAFNEVTVSDMTFRWRVEGEDLMCVVSAPTTGWVSAGFDPTMGMGMQDANIIIGYVYESDNVEIRDDWGTSPHSHADDVSLGGTDDVSTVTGSESDGNTEISFTIPLNTGDEYDKTLSEGETYTIILAYGSADDLGSVHTNRYTTDIEL